MSGLVILAVDRLWRDYSPAELRRRRIPGRRTELCPGCGELFAGASVGDAHRYGPYTARRCYSRAEMAERGMWTDDRDVWHLGAPMDEAAKARRRSAHVNLTGEQAEGVSPLGSAPETPPEPGPSGGLPGGVLEAARYATSQARRRDGSRP